MIQTYPAGAFLGGLGVLAVKNALLPHKTSPKILEEPFFLAGEAGNAA